MKKLILSLLFTGGFAVTGFAQIYFDFGTSAANTGSTTNSSSTIQAGGAIVENNRITVSEPINTSSPSSGYTGFSGNYNIGGITKSIAFDKIESTYIQVTLTPDVGIPVLIKGISFGIRSTGTGAANFSVRSSIDNYNSELAGGVIATSGTWQFKGPYSFDLTGTASTPVNIRIYGYGGTGNGTTINWRLDDLTLHYTTPLPVSLSSFTAKANLQNVDLAWNTASEKDNSHFDVLRSGDGKTFAKIGEVKGAGTTDVAKNYNFTDKNALPSISYYQLKQIDFNGNSVLSEVQAVKSNVAASNFKIATNKQDGSVKLTVFAAREGKATFKIYDVNGHKITEAKLSLNKGYSNISVPFNSSKGLHIASLTTTNETLTQKFIQ